MQCRHFTIRLSPQHLAEDVARLSSFLEQVQAHAVQGALACPLGARWSVLVFFEECLGASTGYEEHWPVAPEATEGLGLEEQRIYERLWAWRCERARLAGLPPEVVAHHAVLVQIARQHMTLSVAEGLVPSRGIGAGRAARSRSERGQLPGAGVQALAA